MSYSHCAVCAKPLSRPNASGRCKRHLRTQGDFPPAPVKRCPDCGVEISVTANHCHAHGVIARKEKLIASLRRYHAPRLGWLPDERRDDYKRLIKCYPEAIAKQMVLDDMRRSQ